jgi:predicted phage-related endonuclease
VNASTPIPHGSHAWHDARRGKITASRAAAILCPGEIGVHGNPFTVWREICRPDDSDGDDLADDDAAEYGRESETLHAAMLARRSGVEWSVRQPGFYVDREFPWLGASPDLIGTKDGREYVAELKAPTDYGIKKALVHGMPTGYAVQLVVQMRVLDVDAGIASVLFAPSPTWQEIQRAADMERQVLDGLTRFYEDFVLTDTAPPMHEDWMDADTLRSWKALNPPREEATVYFDELHPATAAACALQQAKAEIKKWEASAQSAEAALLAAAGDASRIVLPDGSGFTRKLQVRQVKASEARTDTFTVLRFKERMG